MPAERTLSLPSEINLDLEEKQVTAFVYILKNNYKIKIPDIKNIVFDTLFLSDNTLDFLRNILYEVSVNNRKDYIVNFVISYIYALEIYKKFENKLTDNGENVDKDFDDIEIPDYYESGIKSSKYFTKSYFDKFKHEYENISEDEVKNIFASATETINTHI